MEWIVTLIGNVYESVPASDVAKSAWAALAATIALLAFIVNLYVLIGRERKSPTIINKSFSFFLWALIGAGCQTIAALTSWRVPLYAGLVVLIFIFASLFVEVLRMYRRSVHLIDSIDLKYTWIMRSIKNLKRKLKSERPYEYNSLDLPEATITAIKDQIPHKFDGAQISILPDDERLVSMAFALDRHDQANDALAMLATEFLKGGNLIQYMTASRHPLEFLEFLSERLEASGSKLTQFSAQIVAVDAYTPHFGFLDSIYDNATQKIKGQNINFLKTGISFAGIHSASAKAFNTLKKARLAPNSVRRPTAVIYENMHALIDLESKEQYRIFLRHVLPSERLWTGMFTVFIEVAPDEADWKVLSSYASVSVDLRLSAKTTKAK